MKKIVEMVIKLDDLELDGAGVDIISLVENPAIQADFLAFKDEKFVDPKAGESQDEFIDRCIPVLIDEGYDQDQAISICYSTWDSFGVDTSALPPYVDEGLTPEQKKFVLACEQMGEIIPIDSVFIDAARSSFSILSDFLKGLTAIDILGRRGVTESDDEGVEVYRYAGPPAERGFCRAMQRLNKVYRRDEINSLNSMNPGFGEGGSDSYSVFNWKGGVNCRHYWEKLTMFRRGRETVFISQGPANGVAGQSNNAADPSPEGAVPNNARVNFSLNEDQQVVIGPAMIPNKLIKRSDEKGLPYWVYFTEQTIKDISEDFLAKMRLNNTNVEHREDTLTTKNTLLESWIVEDPEKDKSSVYGFQVPKGTWMVSYKINDEDTWKKVKEGKLKGFSVEGMFVERAEAMKANQMVKEQYEKILDILSKVQ